MIALIVAMDKNRGIGKNNNLMWHLSRDMQFFKETTTGHIVVLGRKNYESIPEKYRPLPNRENAILTRNKSYKAPGCRIFHSLEECLKFYKNEVERTVFIIGGGEIYKQSLDLGIVDEMYITHVDKNYDADTFFPEFNSNDWGRELIFIHSQDNKNESDFKVFKYIKKK